MGMRRDGIPMETGATRRPVAPSAAGLAWGSAAAARVAKVVGVRTIDSDELQAWRRDSSRTTYLLDVRTPEEYLAGHLPGSLSTQGGQLVQEIDTYAPVWNARIVLIDDAFLIRARMTASWLLQMGCPEVVTYALGDDALEVGPQPTVVFGLADAGLKAMSPAEAKAAVERDEAVVVDLAPSPQYRVRHISGAHFVTRVRLGDRLDRLPPGRRLLLTSEDGVIARLAVKEQTARGVDAAVIDGGTHAWCAAGLPTSTGMEHVADDVDDAWLPPPQRDGDVHAAIVEYLDWELGLPAEVRRDPSVRFRIAERET